MERRGEAALVLFLPEAGRERSILSVLLQPQGWRDTGGAALPSLLQGLSCGKLLHELGPGKAAGKGPAVVGGEQERLCSAPSSGSSAHRGHSVPPSAFISFWLMDRGGCSVLPEKLLWIVSLTSQGFSVLGLQPVMLVKGGCLSGKLLMISPLLLLMQNCYPASIIFSFHCLTFCL